jgi:hypothetical protein
VFPNFAFRNEPLLQISDEEYEHIGEAVMLPVTG